MLYTQQIHLVKDHPVLYTPNLLTNFQIELLPLVCRRKAVKWQMVLEFGEWPMLILWIAESDSESTVLKTWKEFSSVVSESIRRMSSDPTLYNTRSIF